MTHRSRQPESREALTWVGAVCLALVACVWLGGCAPMSSGGVTALRIDSRDRDTWMAPDYVTAVYRAIDENTADIFLSDIPEDQILERMRIGTNLAAGSDSESGTITHLRLFLTPLAGKTPIDFTASNTTITHVVLAQGTMGVYGGGGFLLPDDAVGSPVFGGRIREASLRLLRSDEGFVDLLGLAVVSGRVVARRDDTLADSISARMVLMLRR